jgi:1-acyl-sn-glycerol-3-phosphate acyltransferase
MAIDGFRPEHHEAFAGYSPTVARHFYDVVSWSSRKMHVDVVGIENVPRGRAVVVANHAFGWDVIFPMAAVQSELQRPVWVLGEHAWWKFPFLRRLVAAVGTVDGTPENADRLLEHDELMLVLPGGLREAVKPRELRYRLLWGDRYGFIRAAIRNQAPIVPLASLGADDLFDFVGNAYRRGERLLRRTGIPVPLPSRILPIPHFVKFRFIFGEPILPPSQPESASDPAVLRRLRHEVEGALHELIENELAQRAGIDLPRGAG